VAREVIRRGGRVAAVSTLAGCIADPLGVDIGLLLALRSAHGDACVAHYGLPVAPPGHLFTGVDADVIVPGTRPGVITGHTAASLPGSVRVIAPAANAPYTEQGAGVLRERDILALPDFVCNAGAVLGYRAPADATPEQVLTAAGITIAEVITAVMACEAGPLAGALAQAHEFLRGWWGEPPRAPFAPPA
jgi:glutamate dehydrogenase (NAD(P)+)